MTAIEEFARRQSARIDDFVDAVAANIGESVPQARNMPPELRQERLAEVRVGLLRGFEAIAGGVPLARFQVELDTFVGRRREQGLDPAYVLSTCDAAYLALLDRLTAQVRGEPDEGPLLVEITRHLLEFQRVLTLAVSRAYGPMIAPVSPATTTGGDRDTEIQAVLEHLTGRTPNTVAEQREFAAVTGARLGLNLPPRQVTVSVPLGDDARAHARAVARVNHWDVVGVLDDRVVALTVRAANGFPPPRGTTGVPADATAGQLGRAVLQAGAAADVAIRLGVGGLSVTESLPLAALLALPASERDDYVRCCFGALPYSPRGRSLLESVARALVHARLADAAAGLHVHRHTLDYRLRRFTEQTGLDLNRPSDRFQCMVGLFMLGMLPTDPDLPEGTA